MAAASPPFIIGWQEWLALSDLGLPAVKAKIDTGARTSALHAFLIEPFGPATEPMVRFGVNPIPGRLDVAVYCSAAIVDRREVTSSNGERETRFFIRTPVTMGERTWQIEVGLTNRETMSYRMLLGRQAIQEDMMVDATVSFRQPRLSYKLYRGMPRPERASRRLRIALVARKADAAFNQRLAREAAGRGHVMELLELERLALAFDDDAAGLLLDGVALAHYDAVIARIGRREGARGAAVVRQLEAMGSLALNPGDAIDRVANRLAAAQALARDRLPQALTGPAGSSEQNGGEHDTTLRVLVAGGKAIAMIELCGDTEQSVAKLRYRSERRLAEHAAAALGLGIAAVDIASIGDRLVVTRVSARPLLGRFAQLCKIDVAAAIMDATEASMRSHGKDHHLQD